TDNQNPCRSRAGPALPERRRIEPSLPCPRGRGAVVWEGAGRVTDVTRGADDRDRAGDGARTGVVGGARARVRGRGAPRPAVPPPRLRGGPPAPPPVRGGLGGPGPPPAPRAPRAAGGRAGLRPAGARRGGGVAPQRPRPGGGAPRHAPARQVARRPG